MLRLKEIRELLLFSVENDTINEEEFFLLSEGFKSKICYYCSQPFYISFVALLEAILQRCNSAACFVGKNSKKRLPLINAAPYQKNAAFIGGFINNYSTLRSDKGDVHKNVAEKQTSHHFKLFRDYPNSPCYLKEGDFGWS